MNEPIDRYFRYSRSELTLLIPSGATRVLEVGCGAGSFRAHFPKTVEYWGIEPNADAAEVAKETLFRVLPGSYQEVESHLPEKYFDLVVCNDVIEHMADHDWFFDNIKCRLADKGFLMGSVPNVRFVDNLRGLLFRRQWEYVDEGVLDRTHLRFFTYQSLLDTFNRHDFEVETCVGVNSIIKKKSNPFRRLRKALKWRAILARLFGNDSQYLQFAFLISVKSSDQT